MVMILILVLLILRIIVIIMTTLKVNLSDSIETGTSREPRLRQLFRLMANIIYDMICTSSSEYWSVLRPSAQISGKLALKFGNQLQFKCDLEQKAL
jgi:hypothetical protein